MSWQTLPNVSLSPSVKKRVKWLATTLSRKPHDLLFFVQDKLSGMKFLVDSGSMVSIIPLSATNVTVSDKPCSNNLFALNNAEVKTFGKCMLSIDIGLKAILELIGVLL